MNTFNILGDIVQDDSQRWFESDVVPAMVIGWLAKQDGDVEININSLGGSVTGGLAIANAIKGYNKGKVTANVLGIAASMASVVACAADEIKMGKGAFLMVHNPWSLAIGEAEDLRKEADVLDQMKDAIIGFYQSKFDRKPEELAALMDAETWIESGHESEYGLAATPYVPEDGDGLKAAAKCDTRMMFAHAPEAAAAYYAHKERPVAEAPKTPTEAHGAETAQPSAEDWAARLAGLQAAKDKEIAALRAELSAKDTEKADAVAAAKAEAASTIESLNAEVAEKTEALGAAKADAEQLRAQLGEAEKALAETRAALAAETERYREQIGLALAPPNAKSGKSGYALVRSKLPDSPKNNQ